MLVRRKIEGVISSALDDKFILAIVGPRKCGKTTLLKKLESGIENSDLISFKDREVLDIFHGDINSFAKKYLKPNKYLFIDDIQYANETGKKLRSLYDNYKTKIILSGTSSLEKLIPDIRYLIGRIKPFNLFPCSFEEFVRFKNNRLLADFKSEQKQSDSNRKKLSALLQEFLIYGGYPQVVATEDDLEKQELLKEIYNSFFLGEFINVRSISDVNVSKLLSSLALRLGNILNYQELILDTGLKNAQLANQLELFQKSFVTVAVKPYYTNKAVEVVKAPKMYFLDNGIRNTIFRNFNDLNFRNDNLALKENFIASEIYKKNDPIFYWRTKSKAELNFIIQKNKQLYPIEIRQVSREKKLSRSLRSFITKYQPAKGMVASEIKSNTLLQSTELSWMPLYLIPYKI